MPNHMNFKTGEVTQRDCDQVPNLPYNPENELTGSIVEHADRNPEGELDPKFGDKQPGQAIPDFHNTEDTLGEYLTETPGFIRSGNGPKNVLDKLVAREERAAKRAVLRKVTIVSKQNSTPMDAPKTRKRKRRRKR